MRDQDSRGTDPLGQLKTGGRFQPQRIPADDAPYSAQKQIVGTLAVLAITAVFVLALILLNSLIG